MLAGTNPSEVGASLESGMAESRRDVRASALRALFMLRRSDKRACLAPDGSIAWLESLAEGRLLFGRQSMDLCKVQAGIKVPGQKPDWKISFFPNSVLYSGRYFEAVEVSHSVELMGHRSPGIMRRIRLRNSGTSAIRLRVFTLCDPTTAQFPSDTGLWGSVGVNAFNRTSHVAMDEMAEPPSARVVGAVPGPKSIFMTTDRARVEEIIREGEIPDSTAGMSGQILILMSHELDLSSQETKEVTILSIYDPVKLESALGEFDRYTTDQHPTSLQQSAPVPQAPPSSSASLSRALLFARAALEGVEFEPCGLDRAECLLGLAFVDPEQALRIVEKTKSELGRSRFLPHSNDHRVPGQLETALFLAGASRLAVLTGDRRYMRSIYPSLRRLADFLSEAERAEADPNSLSLPQGWRRSLGKGFPTGLVSEVLLTSAGALEAASQLAALMGRGEDSAHFTERSELIIDRVRKTLLDERGSLALNIDLGGTVHREDTIDQAVGLSRCAFDKSVASSVIHRLQEKDFQTSFGPRTVPTSNKVFFNGSYGSGQLGGYWTRAALAHVLLSYEAGYAGLASLELQKVASLVADKVVSFGAPPGTFPLWLDMETASMHGRGSDQVAASRLIESVVRGELGFSADSRGLGLHPPASSNLKWILLSGLWLGETGVSLFVGRTKGRVFTYVRSIRVQPDDDGTRFASFEALQAGTSDVAACMFHGPGQVICVGNTAQHAVRTNVRFAPRDTQLLNHLSATLEELDSAGGSWKKLQALRVAPSMSLDFSLAPEEWKVFRLSTA